MSKRMYAFKLPAKLIFIDDNIAFLDAVKLNFSKRYNISTFSSVNDALDSIRKESLIKRYIENSLGVTPLPHSCSYNPISLTYYASVRV